MATQLKTVGDHIAEREADERARADAMNHFLAHQSRLETDPTYAAQAEAERAEGQRQIDEAIAASMARAPAFKPWKWTPGCDVVGAAR